MGRRPAEFHYYDWSFNRWFGSETRARCRSLPSEYPMGLLANAAEGAYRNLLDYCYQDGDIPADLGGLAALCGMSPGIFDLVWPAFRSKFHPHKKDPLRLVHDEVVMRRKNFVQKRKASSENGRAGAQKRGRGIPNENNDIGSHPSATLKPGVPKKEVISNKKKEVSNKERSSHPSPEVHFEFDFDTRFECIWDKYPEKGRTRITEAQQLFVDWLLPLTPENQQREAAALEAAVSPGGVWAESEQWADKGMIFGICDMIRNRRHRESPPRSKRSQRKSEPTQEWKMFIPEEVKNRVRSTS